MPRTIPWLKNASASSPSRPRQNGNDARKREPGGTPRKTGSSSLGGRNTDATQSPSTPRQRTTPTSSPPPPPELSVQEPMREGYDADDIWMMVEDELLATAQLYTQNLHHAEYLRLSQQAKIREQEMASKPSAPMAGFVPHHRPAPSKRKGLAEESSEEYTPPIADTVLAGLMDSPKRQPAYLRRTATAEKMPGSPSVKRHRLDEIRRQEMSESVALSDGTETDDGDLDAPIRARRELVFTESVHPKPLDKVATRIATDSAAHGKRRMVDILAERKVKARSKANGKTADMNNDATIEIPTFLV